MLTILCSELFLDTAVKVVLHLLTFLSFDGSGIPKQFTVRHDSECIWLRSRSFKWVSKASILKIPVVGWAMKRTRTITIEREDRRPGDPRELRERDVLNHLQSAFCFWTVCPSCM